MRCNGGLHVACISLIVDDEDRSGVYPLKKHSGSSPLCKNRSVKIDRL